MSYASRCTLLVARCSITSPPFTSRDRKSTRLNSSHSQISYAVFCLKKKKEHNKQILKMGNNGADVTPKGGFLRYGPVKTEYAVLLGSIPGPARRLVALRYPTSGIPTGEPPKLEQLNLASKQGA